MMQVEEIEKKAKQKKSYHPLPLNNVETKLPDTKGTRIILRDLKKKRSIMQIMFVLILPGVFRFWGTKLKSP